MLQPLMPDPVMDTVDCLVAALCTSGPPVREGTMLDDAESRRGCALLEESRLSAEAPARLARDKGRLLLGEGGRGPIAPLAAPPPSADALARLRVAMAAGGLVVPGQGGDLVDVLRLLAVLGPARRDEPQRHALWRDVLVHEHLLTWGARCLSRMQLGAQTFFYQGVASLGLGLLRHLSEELHCRSTAS